LLCWSWS